MGTQYLLRSPLPSGGNGSKIAHFSHSARSAHDAPPTCAFLGRGPPTAQHVRRISPPSMRVVVKGCMAHSEDRHTARAANTHNEHQSACCAGRPCLLRNRPRWSCFPAEILHSDELNVLNAGHRNELACRRFWLRPWQQVCRFAGA